MGPLSSRGSAWSHELECFPPPEKDSFPKLRVFLFERRELRTGGDCVHMHRNLLSAAPVDVFPAVFKSGAGGVEEGRWNPRKTCGFRENAMNIFVTT